jgi:hypothetical protein
VATTLSRLPRSPATAALPRWVGRHKALVAFCALVGAYYFWTVFSSGSPVAFGQDRSDYYNLLSDGLLRGHLSLPVQPNPKLLELHNPFDPAKNGAYKLHDLSLYHGKYYLYWGPVPALLLFIPFRLLPLGDLPETLAVFVFAFVGFCFSIACLRLLARRFAPDAPRWMLGAAAVALAFGNALPFTLRRVAVYEVAICAGFCLAFIALYLLITGLQDGVRPRRLLLASLMVGLAVGARPTMAIWALGLVVLAVVLAARVATPQERLRIGGLLLGPMAAVGALLVAYNVLRFGSPAEFGQKYQLAGYDPATRQGNKLAYVPPGLWYYLLARPHVSLGFPFVTIAPPSLSYPLTAPRLYDGVEPVGGLLMTTPFVLLALLAPMALRGAARRTVYALVAVGLLIIAMASFALWGATMRYEVDFASTLLIAAAVTWLALAARLHGRSRRALGVGGAALIAWGVLCGAAFGISGYYNSLRGSYPSQWDRLERLTSPVPTLLSKLDGKPQQTDVLAPGGLTSDSDAGPGVGRLAFPLKATPVKLTVASGSPTRYGLQLSATPPKPLPGGAQLIVETPDTGRALQLAPQLGPTTVPIALRRGLNRITFRLTGAKGGTTQLADVHIVPLPR